MVAIGRIEPGFWHSSLTMTRGIAMQLSIQAASSKLQMRVCAGT